MIFQGNNCKMLKSGEKKRVKEILKLLEAPDVLQLARTITLNKLIPSSAKEAVDLILRYESSFQSFLHHKKISREVLFQFMHNQNIPVLPKEDKKSMITKIIHHFKEQPLSAPKDECGQNRNLQREVEPVCNQQPQILQGEDLSNQQQILRTSPGESSHMSEYKHAGGSVNDLALEFSKWFYSMMNQERCMSIEHFWTDCNVKLYILNNRDSVEHSVVQSAQESVQLLWQTKTQHRLLFNPNITSEGVRGIVEMHGLVMVLACGSLHQEQKCVGVFEQKFGLIRDPSALNNWKIKFMELFLRSTNAVNALPSLQDADFINNSSIHTAN